MAFLTSSPVDGLSGSTLILPACGLGEVASAAVDVLLTALYRAARVEFVAPVRSPHVVNVCGASTFAGEFDGAAVPVVSTALELYRVRPSSPTVPAVFILQQRAPIREGAQDLWALAVVSWAASAGVRRLLVLGVADSSCRTDAHLGSEAGHGLLHVAGGGGEADFADLLQCTGSKAAPPPVDIAAEGASDSSDPLVHASEWPEWQPLSGPALAVTASLFTPLAGLGLAPHYFRRAESGVRRAESGVRRAESGVRRADGGTDRLPTLVVFGFAAEGDNRGDARALAKAVAGCVALDGAGGDNFDGPKWWAQELDGPDFDQALYG